MPYRGKGVIKRHKSWKLTPKRKAALQRLAELRVDVHCAPPGENYTLVIPHDLIAPGYIEIGYLMAQLGNEQFPEHYECLSDTETTVFKHVKGSPRLVSFVDSYPHGMKYRVTPRQEENALE